ncbi:MAG: peptidylprolyl isomerase [Candidatus Micrarchaeota archaeon]
MAVKKGDAVKVSYVGVLENGTRFDSSAEHGAPLKFVVGSGQVIKGFDEAVIGMEKDEEKQVALGPKEAYGESDPALIRDIPKARLPQQELKPGMVMGMQLPDGRTIPGRVIELTEEGAKVDFNHELAGKTLLFQLKLVDYTPVVSS